ncbi:hypothetical protein BO83DRAFT_416324 [Aspergillus eucalypticola CBS 122712]|uniref:Uncharacterized protein n=1 Tax=Aspergillus eucalypticola (strain CBS 122712 / IBT 29274) TaxID=1448314 RepID=A0A317VMZ4_ASPEC|nr:uncharacterized protein BO83DRAFT_416324 [Aspergillus eucalypticola CBS 122712]PWY75704.1 hypothetical protein BO83DRAFT_416324 [Aspergillus eucalypticola CBS 122712]
MLRPPAIPPAVYVLSDSYPIFSLTELIKIGLWSREYSSYSSRINYMACAPPTTEFTRFYVRRRRRSQPLTAITQAILGQSAGTKEQQIVTASGLKPTIRFPGPAQGKSHAALFPICFWHHPLADSLPTGRLSAGATDCVDWGLTPTCSDQTFFTASPGLSSLDSGPWGDIILSDPILASVRTYVANGNANGGPVANSLD